MPERDSDKRRSVVDAVNSDGACRWHIPEREFYVQSTIGVATALLGCLLLRIDRDEGSMQFTGGRIVEVEAYLGEDDPASHASAGITRRTKILYSGGGVAYIYNVHGVYHCFNVVAGPHGLAGGVLVRALEPIFGLPTMEKRRSRAHGRAELLCSGPGRLCEALDIDIGCNGFDLICSDILVLLPAHNAMEISAGPRIGISKAADWPLRFWIRGSRWTSRKADAAARGTAVAGGPGQRDEEPIRGAP